MEWILFSYNFCLWCFISIVGRIPPHGQTSEGRLLAALPPCNSVTTIPLGVLIIPKGLYIHCEKMYSVSLPESIVSVEDSAFEGCSNLTAITLPRSLTSIGDKAFSKTGLVSVTIPNSVKSIGLQAFAFCPRLSYLSFLNDSTSIASNTFEFDFALKFIFTSSSTLYNKVKDSCLGICVRANQNVSTLAPSPAPTRRLRDNTQSASIDMYAVVVFLAIFSFMACACSSFVVIFYKVYKYRRAARVLITDAHTIDDINSHATGIPLRGMQLVPVHADNDDPPVATEVSIVMDECGRVSQQTEREPRRQTDTLSEGASQSSTGTVAAAGGSSGGLRAANENRPSVAAVTGDREEEELHSISSYDDVIIEPSAIPVRCLTGSPPLVARMVMLYPSYYDTDPSLSTLHSNPGQLDSPLVVESVGAFGIRRSAPVSPVSSSESLVSLTLPVAGSLANNAVAVAMIPTSPSASNGRLR